MSKNSVVKLSGREVLVDPLTELLRRGAEQLIYQAVEAELKELLTVHSERRTEAGKAGGGAQRLFTEARAADRVGPGDGEDCEGAG
jgi:putative transposase